VNQAGAAADSADQAEPLNACVALYSEVWRPAPGDLGEVAHQLAADQRRRVFGAGDRDEAERMISNRALPLFKASFAETWRLSQLTPGQLRLAYAPSMEAKGRSQSA
jgi:hypothetical protein